MAICLTFGEQTFRSQVPGYEGLTVRCFNCGNYSGHVVKSHSFVTICFIPLIPLSFHGYKDVVCDICRFAQPLESRPDVTNMHGGGGGPPPGLGPGPGPAPPQGYHGSPPPQGWGNQPPGNREQMRYG